MVVNQDPTSTCEIAEVAPVSVTTEQRLHHTRDVYPHCCLRFQPQSARQKSPRLNGETAVASSSWVLADFPFSSRSLPFWVSLSFLDLSPVKGRVCISNVQHRQPPCWPQPPVAAGSGRQDLESVNIKIHPTPSPEPQAGGISCRILPKTPASVWTFLLLP